MQSIVDAHNERKLEPGCLWGQAGTCDTVQQILHRPIQSVWMMQGLCAWNVMVCHLPEPTWLQLELVLETHTLDFISISLILQATLTCAWLQWYKGYKGRQELCWTASPLPAGHRYHRHHLWLRLTVFCCHSVAFFNHSINDYNFSFFWSATYILHGFSNLTLFIIHEFSDMQEFHTILTTWQTTRHTKITCLTNIFVEPQTLAMWV